MFSTSDFNQYDELNYQRRTDSSNCYSIYKSIQILRSYNAYVLLKTHTNNLFNMQTKDNYITQNAN